MGSSSSGVVAALALNGAGDVQMLQQPVGFAEPTVYAEVSVATGAVSGQPTWLQKLTQNNEVAHAVREGDGG